MTETKEQRQKKNAKFYANHKDRWTNRRDTNVCPMTRIIAHAFTVKKNIYNMMYLETHDELRREKDKRFSVSEKGRIYQRNKAARMIIRYPEKYKARYALSNAVRLGLIKREPCQVCGNPKSEAHHDDYSKPLEVKWLCHYHHCETENRLRPRPFIEEGK